jgi:hypothetical protein
VLGIFKRRKWIPDVIPEMTGAYRNLKVVVRGMPCLKDEQGTTRKYAYYDFGAEFINELHTKLGRPDMLATQLNTGAPVHAMVVLKTYAPISVELRGKPDPKVDQFVSDIADVLIEAFKSADLRP